VIKILLAAIRSVAKPINEIECSGQEFAPAWPLRSLFPTLATIELDGNLENRGQDLTCLDEIKPHARNCTGEFLVGLTSIDGRHRVLERDSLEGAADRHPSLGLTAAPAALTT
jgi:hypothetical protein